MDDMTEAHIEANLFPSPLPTLPWHCGSRKARDTARRSLGRYSLTRRLAQDHRATRTQGVLSLVRMS